ncbi:hypothetical protein YC2023_045656 [Brassica napus]
MVTAGVVGQVMDLLELETVKCSLKPRMKLDSYVLMSVGLLSLEKKQYIYWKIYIKCNGYYLKRKRQESYSLGEKGKLLKLSLEELGEQVLKRTFLLSYQNEQQQDKKKKEDEKLEFCETATKVIGIVGVVGTVVGLLWLIGSESKKEKMMKAPGQDGYIVRRDFENSAKDYFKDLRGKK